MGMSDVSSVRDCGLITWWLSAGLTLLRPAGTSPEVGALDEAERDLGISRSLWSKRVSILHVKKYNALSQMCFWKRSAIGIHLETTKKLWKLRFNFFLKIFMLWETPAP